MASLIVKGLARRLLPFESELRLQFSPGAFWAELADRAVPPVYDFFGRLLLAGGTFRSQVLDVGHYYE